MDAVALAHSAAEISPGFRRILRKHCGGGDSRARDRLTRPRSGALFGAWPGPQQRHAMALFGFRDSHGLLSRKSTRELHIGQSGIPGPHLAVGRRPASRDRAALGRRFAIIEGADALLVPRVQIAARDIGAFPPSAAYLKQWGIAIYISYRECGSSTCSLGLGRANMSSQKYLRASNPPTQTQSVDGRLGCSSLLPATWRGMSLQRVNFISFPLDYNHITAVGQSTSSTTQVVSGFSGHLGGSAGGSGGHDDLELADRPSVKFGSGATGMVDYGAHLFTRGSADPARGFS